MSTPSGILSEPKQLLREMLAECAAFRAFLGVGSEAEALAKTHTEFIVGGLEEKRPLAIVTINEILIEAISSGGQSGSLQLHPKQRSLKVELFCDDPGQPRVVENKVDVNALQTGTLLLENAVGQILEELKNLSAVEDRLAISSLHWNQNWLRGTEPKNWLDADSNPECYTYFLVGVQW